MPGPEQRRKLLEHIAALDPDEDASSKVTKVFLPLTQHQLALRRDVVVIQGTRGAGKTALFRVLRERGSDLKEFFEDRSIPDARWVDAYSEMSTEHPAGAVLDDLVARVGPDGDVALRAFWAAHLLARLGAEGVTKAKLPDALEKARSGAPNHPLSWIEAAERETGSVMSTLDQVDAALTASKQIVFASYDHLDRLGILDRSHTTRQRLIRALLALWLANSSRYRGLRGKLFLRPDLFEEAEDSFTDASKLRSRSVLLSWDVSNLYRLTVRHLANRGPYLPLMRDWLGGIGLSLVEHPSGSRYGLMIAPMETEDQKHFANALAGEAMGTGPKKGYTYRWIPARLRDAGGAIMPRSFLRLLRHAAEDTLREGPPRKEPLMDPERLVGALKSTSEDRVSELGDEYRFVTRLTNLAGQTLLMDRSKMISQLSRRTTDDGYGTDGRAVFEELVRIGVIEIRSDGRVDIPDIYRYGYGIKRKGGARAPR